MKIISTDIPEVLVIEPAVYGDARGFFMESYNVRAMREIGIDANFVQDNHSRSTRNVLRGLHYQLRHPQGKLVRVVSGRVFDVAVDIRLGSPTFGKWAGVELTAENKQMFWIPKGFAHGFMVLSETADFLYKASDFYDPQSERSIQWNDPDIGVQWPLEGTPLLSDKDKAGVPLKDAEVFAISDFVKEIHA
jgi:dTDP-4-dehydrorhamnose 3,5-epimerase